MNRKESFKQRVTKNFMENKILLIVCAIVWVLTIALTLFLYKTSLGMDSIGNSDYSNAVEVNENTNIKQILPIENQTSSFGLDFATYRRRNKGKITVEIVGNDTNIVYLDKTINVSSLQDNAFHIFALTEELNPKKDKNILISVSSTSKEGKGVGIYYGKTKQNENETLTINNESIDGTIAYRFMIKNDALNKFNSIVIISTISVLSLLIIWLLLYRPKLEYFFATFVFVLGLIFMFIMSPSSPPDETIHLEYALQESNLLMFNDDVYEVDSQYIDYIANNYYKDTINNKEAYIDLIENFNNEFIPDKNVETYDVNINDVYKVPYLPQSIGIAIGRLLKFNPIKTFYCGRLTNLLFYVLCVFIGIRKTPIHKTLFGILVSLPITIQQAASMSYDSFINGMCFLTIACIFKMKFSNDRVSIRDVLFAFVINLLLSPAKYIYGLLALLFWLIPYEKYGSKKKKTLCSLLFCAPMIYQLYPIIVSRMIYMIRKAIAVYAETNEVALAIEEAPLYTSSYVVKHFAETLKVIATTIRYNLKTWFFESIGRYISQLTLVLPLALSRLIILIIIAATFIKESIVLNIKTRLAFIAACVSVAMFSIGGMLFSETHVGDQYISGIQGRYFSPLLPYFFVSLTNNKINIPKKFDRYVIFAYIVVIFEVIVYILSYTFVN